MESLRYLFIYLISQRAMAMSYANKNYGNEPSQGTMALVVYALMINYEACRLIYEQLTEAEAVPF